MSILIKGMDMPESCEDCPCAYFTEGAYSDECQVTHKHITDEKPTDCPLIEIPTPHGRLIDADEFTDVCEILADKGGDIRPWEQAEWIAKDMPTILEAEEE